MKKYFVYILASKRNGTLYIGMTNDLIRRIYEHKEKIFKGFTSKYGINMLVYYEEFKYVNDAITRESQIKKWNRNWKIELIESINKDWNDLYNDMVTDKMLEGLKDFYNDILDSRFRGNDKEKINNLL